MAKPIPVPKRTQGDGMENVDILKSNEPSVVVDKDIKEGSAWSDPLSGLSQKLFRADIHPKLTAKEDMKSKHLIYLKPVIVSKQKTLGPALEMHMKEPKFVPFEPYKAAVRPMVTHKKMHTKNKILVETRFRTVSLSTDCKSECAEKDVASFDGDDTRLEQLEVELQRVKIENVELEKQFNYQVQVNGELKHLLVAAVGEDMETRVNSLTEDKLHLAQALLNSAKSLSTHQEQVEWLASQCEVYRSKFLASSVMVEELAGWKAALSQKINEGHHVLRKLLDERRHLRKTLLHMYTNLVLIRDSFDFVNRRTALDTSNISDISSECLNISNLLIIQLLGGVKTPEIDPKLQELPHFTEAEQSADFLLKNPHPMHLSQDPDAACSAVVGAAVALSGQLYHQSHPPRISCCPQCTGEIKLV